MGGKEISKYEKAASIISSARINKTKLREIDNHIYTYEKAFDRFSIDDLNRFFEYDTMKIEIASSKNKSTK